jgi:hypothetical protein
VAGEPDGTLHDWSEIADAEAWQGLLLGNGLSINVWQPFGYQSLMEQAAKERLTDADRALFDGTTNFERVLADVNTAVRVAETVGVDATPIYERYRSIQQALGHAVRQVHLPRARVPAKALATIRSAMASSEWVFTTSYDLLIYWAMGHGGRYRPFKDHFRFGGRCEFDPRRHSVYEGEVPVYYLHGALHLVVDGSGTTWKRVGSLQTILDQFGQPIDGDSQARPLLVTEGSARDKLRAIEANEYLTRALDQLREMDLPLVVFGSGLGPQDEHLVAAIGEHPARPLAISMRAGPRAELLARQSEVFLHLGAERIYFYDAATHPLGARDLAARSPGAGIR